MNYDFIFALIAALAAVGLALTVAWTERRSAGHQSFVLGMAILAAESLCSAMAVRPIAFPDPVYWQTARLAVMSLLPGVWLFFSFCYARGNSREFLVRWRSTLIGILVAPPFVAVVFFRSIIVAGIADGQSLLLGHAGIALHLLFMIGALLTLMNLERTFRTSVGMMRWRIKYMILGLGLLFAARAYTSSQALLFQALKLPLETVNSVALLLGCLLMLRAVLRAGHFEVSLYPSHAVLHRSLTGVLASVYLILVGIFARKVALIYRWDATFTAFIVLVFLVLFSVVLLSDRVRLRTRRFVSRHFQRPLYDYRTVWRSFTLGTASRTDQQELCRASVKLVADVFQVLSVTIWLVDDQDERFEFAASTVLTDTAAATVDLSFARMPELLRGMCTDPEPVDLVYSTHPWAKTLRESFSAQFVREGGLIGVPLLVGAKVVGLLTVGDRIGGIAFSSQDFELLACVGDQMAASILNAQLSEKLLHARELEAFQTMSTFFVHDLKNTASTLNLMLRNLPVHFDDPEFRADALRGIAKTVDHINGLIERLGMLRQGLKIQAVDCDLNAMITRSLAGWKAGPELRLVTDFQAVPRLAIDQDQIAKVLINLVINAGEAMGGRGEIRLTTAEQSGWAVISVADTGCGIPPEFIRQSLFRPFQSTKKGGLGIGMFQSKMIVEAHGGRLEVRSTPGEGTTFQVLLPLARKSK